MDSETIERVFGGISYLSGASSKQDFFQSLEAFLAELFGPVRFTILSEDPRGSRHAVEHTNHPQCPLGAEASSGLSRRLRSLQEARRDLAGPGDDLVLEGRALPLAGGGRLLGDGLGRSSWILFHDPLPPAGGSEVFGLEDLAFDHIAAAYFRHEDQERLKSQLSLCEARLAAINGVGELLGSLDEEVLLTKLLEITLFIASAQVGSVVLVGQSGVESRVEWGLPLEVARMLRFRGGPAVLDRVLQTGCPEMIQDFSDPDLYEGVPDLRVDSYLCIPLHSKKKLLGALNLLNPAEGGFRAAERESILTITSLAATSLENAILHRESLEKERLAGDLRVARSIQQRMYPKDRPQLPGYSVAWASLTCDETGGDYFDLIPVDEDALAVVIGDASGHGVGAALLMSAGRASLRALFSVKRSIGEAMTALDGLLSGDMDDQRFMTLFLARLDHRRHLVSYLNAGHDPPLLFRRRTGEVECFPSTGFPLGVAGEASEHDEPAPRSLEPGDVLLLFTDGSWEATGPGGAPFGKARLTQALVRHASSPAPDIVDALQEEIAFFTRGAERRDDLTLLCIKREE